MIKKVNSILLIDDDNISSYLNQMVLEDMHLYNIIYTVSEGREALDFLQKMCSRQQAAQNKCPEIVFLDLNLPDCSGFELLDQLNKHQDIDLSSTFVFMLTSSLSSKDAQMAKQYPIHGYISKPLTEEKVKLAIEGL